MTDYVRMIAIGGTIGTLVAGALASPSFVAAVAAEPMRAVSSTVKDLFGSDAIDHRQFRKYRITFDDSVSTEVQRVRTVKKIEMGRTSTVSIVTTPSGTYSTDAMLSPHVRYPGIEVERKKHWWARDSFSFYSYNGRSGGSYMSFGNGSFSYYSF
jgi:hypothetical protein